MLRDIWFGNKTGDILIVDKIIVFAQCVYIDI